jgi:hypothetical protein
MTGGWNSKRETRNPELETQTPEPGTPSSERTGPNDTVSGKTPYGPVQKSGQCPVQKSGQCPVQKSGQCPVRKSGQCRWTQDRMTLRFKTARMIHKIGTPTVHLKISRVQWINRRENNPGWKSARSIPAPQRTPSAGAALRTPGSNFFAPNDMGVGLQMRNSQRNRGFTIFTLTACDNMVVALQTRNA